MKIAHVTATFPPYWGGTGNVAYHNARLLHERGYEVTVFTAWPVGRGPLQFPFEVAYLPAPFRIGNAPLTPALLSRLNGFDLIHLHLPYIFGGELAAAAARRFAIPLVITYHNDLLAPGPRGHIFTAYHRLSQTRVLWQADLVLATSDDYARHSALAEIAGLPLAVLSNGVDATTFCPAAKKESLFGFPAGTPVVLFVGAMDSAHFFKGVPVLLEALRALPEVHAVLVGFGDLVPAFQETARKLGQRVRFAGSVEIRELVKLYQGATVTVLPSVTSGEAFGVVLLESLACGTPVIATDLPGVRTVVRPGTDGLTVPPGDAAALAAAIREVVCDQDKAHAMGQAGRRKIEAEYDWERVGDALLRHYAQLWADTTGEERSVA